MFVSEIADSQALTGARNSPGTNTLAYFDAASVEKKKQFYIFAIRRFLNKRSKFWSSPMSQSQTRCQCY
jgi:hypothetical protein